MTAIGISGDEWGGGGGGASMYAQLVMWRVCAGKEGRTDSRGRHLGEGGRKDGRKD